MQNNIGVLKRMEPPQSEIMRQVSKITEGTEMSTCPVLHWEARGANFVIFKIADSRFRAAWSWRQDWPTRALAIAVFLAVAASQATMLVFALAMGASHMATLPPTAQLLARNHGVAGLGALGAWLQGHPGQRRLPAAPAAE